MANITSTQVNDSTATVIAAQALGYLKANTVLSRLVARDWDDEIATHGQVVRIPFAGSLSVNDKAEGSVVTLQQPADTKVDVTLNKHKEVSFLMEDFANAISRPDWIGRYMADGVAKIAEQIDADIAALYSGLSQTIAALTANGGLKESDFREARRLLNAAKAPLSNRVAVLGEDAEKEFWGIEKFVNADYRRSVGGALSGAYGGTAYGFDVFMDQVIVASGSQIKNLFMHRDALVLCTRQLPPAPAGAGVVQKTMSEDGVGLRVTLSYNPDYLGVQVTIDVLYGVAELRDAFGVAVSTTEV
jgi:hypothetical protein